MTTTLETKLPTSPPSTPDTKQYDNSRDGDSGVFLSDNEDTALPSTPSRQTSISLKHTPSSSSSTPRRLRRPTDLNLSKTSATDASKHKSELELRYDLVRNSSSKNRAALKSPTQLLNDRLGLTTKKPDKEKEKRIFTPPQPMLNGCVLPAPQRQIENGAAHGAGKPQGRDVRARTEKGGRPAWWCKFDRLVILDGAEACADVEGGYKFFTRSSKGLSIARRRGGLETVVIPLDCKHCQDMLNRTEWKCDVQVCKRGVCWDCKERCRWEMDLEKQKTEGESDTQDVVGQGEGKGNRERADSVLQSEVREDELMRKVGIESGARSPIETAGGIDERLDVC